MFRGSYRMADRAEALITKTGLDSIMLPSVLVCGAEDPRINASLLEHHERTQNLLAQAVPENKLQVETALDYYMSSVAQDITRVQCEEDARFTHRVNIVALVEERRQLRKEISERNERRRSKIQSNTLSTPKPKKERQVTLYMMMKKQMAKICQKQGLALGSVPLYKPFDLPRPACFSSVTIPPGVLVSYPSDLQAELDELLANSKKEKALMTSNLPSSQQLDSTYDTS